jgi:predicted S18 family serine protease
MKKLLSALILLVSIIALVGIGVTNHVNAQGGGISVTVSYNNGSPTTITYTTTTVVVVPTTPIPGFTFEAIVLGLIVGLVAMVLLRRSSRSANNTGSAILAVFGS